MDGAGCWRDNVFVERLWRSVKYEEVYLRAYDSISAARQGVGRYLTCYNQTRPHRALAERVNEFGTLAVGIECSTSSVDIVIV